jgi:hypothetical protein
MLAEVPSTFTVRAWLAMKPWARMVTPVVPTMPVVGLSPVAEAVTVNLVAEVAVLPEASVTTTLWAPWGTTGMVKVTVEVPLAPVAPPEVMVAAVPSTVTLSAELAAKPCAVIVAEDPTTPVAGLSPVAEAVTAKLVAEVAVLDEASVTTTLYEPLTRVGMVKVTVEDPVPAVAPPAVMVAVVPPTVTASAELAAKPWAVIEVEDPTAPVAGLRLVAVALTVKVVVEVAELVASETTTLSGPLGAAGKVKVTVEAPLAPVVPPAVTVAAVPSTFTVRAWLAMKPWARIVTPVVPTVPVVGLSPVAEVVTVNLVAEVAVLAEASVTTTLWAPWGTTGMVKVTGEDPVASVVPPAVMVAVVPSTVRVSAELAAKPWARIDAEEPTVPLAGLSPEAEAVTVKLVAEVAVLPEASVTTTLWAPLGTAGMVKVTVVDPVAAVVPPAVMVAVVPSTVTVSAELAAKP